MSKASGNLTRRHLIGAVLALGSGIVAGCGSKPSRKEPGSEAGPRLSSLRQAAITVYRDPACGCCGAWAKAAKEAGFAVSVIATPDMPAIKRKHGVPAQLESCHTSIAGGYTLEGHVPLEDVKRLLRERPKNIRGISVPGMPRGAPGMEMADGSRDRFQVIAFDSSGKLSLYRRV